MRSIIFAIMCFVLISPLNAFAGSGHYASGGEGLLAATLPPK